MKNTGNALVQTLFCASLCISAHAKSDLLKLDRKELEGIYCLHRAGDPKEAFPLESALLKVDREKNEAFLSYKRKGFKKTRPLRVALEDFEMHKETLGSFDAQRFLDLTWYLAETGEGRLVRECFRVEIGQNPQETVEVELSKAQIRCEFRGSNLKYGIQSATITQFGERARLEYEVAPVGLNSKPVFLNAANLPDLKIRNANDWKKLPSRHWLDVFNSEVKANSHGKWKIKSCHFEH